MSIVVMYTNTIDLNIVYFIFTYNGLVCSICPVVMLYPHISWTKPFFLKFEFYFKSILSPILQTNHAEKFEITMHENEAIG